MATRLSKIEIKNFKTFSHVCVNNFKSLNMVVGSNGSGKSNFVEAIAFCLGENKFGPRSGNLKNFMNLVSTNDEKEYYVSCTFTYNMEDITFKRTLRKNRNIFTINNNAVNKGEYESKLNEIGINTKTRYFIVHQGESLESLLEKPKERAARFEEITGSIKYKKTYDYLQNTLEQQLSEQITLNEQKRIINRKIRSQKLDKSKIKFRSDLQSEYEILARKLTLLQLYAIEENIKSHKKEYQLLEEKKIDKIKIREKIIADRERKNEIQAENESEMISLKSQVEVKQNELMNVKKELRASLEKIKIIEQSIHNVGRNISKVERAKKLQTERIKQIKDDYEMIEKLYKQTKKQLHELNDNSFIKIEKDYNTINTEIYSKQADDFMKSREIHFSRNILLENIKNRKKIITKKQNEIKQVDTMMKNYNKYVDQYKNLSDEFIKLKEEKEEKEKLIKSYREKEQELEQQLMDIEKQLHISSSPDTNSKDNEKKVTVVESLREKIPEGVHGYINDLCHPVHSRYEIALNIILNKYSSTIVVDTERTAQLCHDIAANFPGRIKFLTLDLLETPKIKNINEVEGIENVKLAIDLVEYPERIKKAVLHIFRDTLVCETPEDAFQVAYSLKSKYPINCITLDGINYKNNGMIFKNKSMKKNNISDTLSLKDARKKLLVELDDIKKQLALISSNQTEKLLKMKFECIEKNISIGKMSLTKCEEQKKKREQLESELSGLMNKEEEDQQQLKKLNEEENELKGKIRSHEKKLYEEFYKKHNITDASQFEEFIKKLTKLRADQEKYVNHMKGLKTALEFEKGDDTNNNLEKYEIESGDLKRQLQEETDRLVILKKAENEKLKQLELVEKQLKKIVNDNAQLNKDLLELKKHQVELTQEFYKLEYNRYQRCVQLYKQCYHEFIHLLFETKNQNLPFIKGSYDSIQNSFDLNENDDFIMHDTPSDGTPIFNIDQEHSFQLDYSSITNEIANNDINNIRLICKKLKSELQLIDDKISELYIVDKQCSQESEEMKVKFQALNQQINELTKNIVKTRSNFHAIQQKRREQFMNGFDVISEWVKKIYKLLCGDEDAHAFLEALNLEEPYLGDIQYICLPRRKKFNGDFNLSGGEKIIAMLSLILAVLKVDSTFLLLFDEIDAPLDEARSRNVIKYLRTLNESHQIIYTTFNRNSMSCAEKLIGIQTMKHNGLKSSQVFTLNPDNY